MLRPLGQGPDCPRYRKDTVVMAVIDNDRAVS